MKQDQQQYARILIAVDGSGSAKKAFEKAILIAKRNNSELIIVHVIDSSSYNMGIESATFNAIEVDATEMEELLKKYSNKAREAGVKSVKTELTKGSPKQLLSVNIPSEFQTDLIVVGSTGLNMIERWMIGSVSEYIIREAHCDVLVVRNTKKRMN
ncbi:Nucleotide-binding universal stress protein, UspA family [Carnobacterium iners]|uniref:Universal stress protein n=1 Tax=Carnobacterium iners TaxID=1073423 RepID=A0A1X7NS80_9LACT|nr:universal stress protein [Carnobacterium iners]SEK27407.1 Nucleotide-binding universal stress protein, UspA family [Carnobacterium iners]SMH40049.1 Nucleotide-binding universal stress protein, UspA family [Carnobacterium iners]